MWLSLSPAVACGATGEKCGDSWLRSGRRFVSLADDAGAAGLTGTSRWRLAVGCGTGEGLSYPADSSRKRIDYLFSTPVPGIECTHAEVLATNASDHRPVLFTLRVRNN